MDNSPVSERNRIVVSKSNLEANGDIIVGGHKSINIYQVSDYESVAKEIEERRQQYARTNKMLQIVVKSGEEKEFALELKKALKSIKKDLKVLRNKALSMQQEILKLAETFSEIEINSDRLKKAKELFGMGRLKEASQLLGKNDLAYEQERLLLNQEYLVSRQQSVAEGLSENAKAYLLKAQFTATDFDNPHRFKETVEYFQQSIKSVSGFNNNFMLACFLLGHNRLIEAEQYFMKALEAPAGRPEQKANALYNIGVIYQDRRDFEGALKFYNRSVEAILGGVAEGDPARPAMLAARYNSIGSLYQDFQDYSRAANFLDKALDTLGEAPAEGAPLLLEAKADLLNNLGALHEARKQWGDALIYYLEARRLYQRLVSESREEYLHKEAFLLSNLGALYQGMEKQEEALDSYLQSLEIYSRLADKNPDTYSHDLGVVHINLGIYYFTVQPDREQSIQHAEEGVRCLEPFLEEMPSLQPYYETGQEVLEAWNNA